MNKFHVLLCILILLMYSCSDPDSTDENLYDLKDLKLKTNGVSQIGSASALGGGSFDGNFDPNVISAGIVWSLKPKPTLRNQSIQNYPSSSYFPLEVGFGPLTPNTQYYVRAYAITTIGPTYGNEVTFTTADKLLYTEGGGVTDVEGNVYKTIVIGSQEWMAENLNTSTFSNGDKIPNVTDDNEWSQLTTPAWRQDDPQKDRTYNWYVVSDPRNVCPNGWHIPNSPEFAGFVYSIGGQALAGIRMISDEPVWESQC